MHQNPMIRAFLPTDMDAVLAIWLSASTQAHDFVPADFWRSQLDNMRTRYIPGAEVFVYEQNQAVAGFCALRGDWIAALFVAPRLQGAGIGKALLAHAKGLRHTLSLSVYKANAAGVAFYQGQDFLVTEEGLDEETGQQEYSMRWARGGPAGPQSQ